MVNVPVGTLALALIGAFLHEDFERRNPRIDYIGSVLVLTPVGVAISGLLQGGQAWAWNSPENIAVFAFAVVLLAGWCGRSNSLPLVSRP